MEKGKGFRVYASRRKKGVLSDSLELLCVGHLVNANDLLFSVSNPFEIKFIRLINEA